MYKNYSDEELIEAYTSMMDYSGEPSVEMLAAIEARGGLEHFRKKVEGDRAMKEEIEHLKKEIFAHIRSGSNPDFMKKTITSKVLTQEQLEKLIETKYIEYKEILANRAITPRTVSGTIAGVSIGVVLGSVLLIWIGKLLSVHQFIFFPIIYFMNYFLIVLFTRQSRTNTLIFMGSFFGSLVTYAIAMYFKIYF